MSAREARAFWVVGAGRGEVRSETLAPPGEGEVLVRALYSGISRGTESLVFEGLVPPSEYGRMRAPFQAGEFPWPVKYGYASVGRVEEGPTDLRGRLVFSLYPHQTKYVLDRQSVHAVPPGVPPSRAVLAANLETAVNGIWDADLHIGDRLVVIGAGTIGCLAAWLASRVIGCDVQLVDVNAARAAVASRLGVRFATPAGVWRDVDGVMHASGSPDGLALALEIAGVEATIVDLSWYGTRSATLALGGPFHSRRLTVKSSQVGAVSPRQRPRWDARRRIALALSLLRHDELDALLTGESEFESLPALMPQLARAPGRTLCHVVRYPG